MVNVKSSADDFTDFLYCLGSLERKNSQLFEALADKTVLSEVKSKLLTISRGNETHAKVLIKWPDGKLESYREGMQEET